MRLPNSSFALFLVLFAVDATASEIKKEVDASPGESLDLELETGAAIEIRGWDEARVRVEARLSGSPSRLEVEKKGRRVVVRLETESRGSSTSHRLEIKVPRRFDVRIDSAGGAIDIKGIEGRFEGQTGGGEIVLDRLKGYARLSTGGGRIEVTRSELDGKVSTGAGRVRLEDIRGGLRGTSGSEPQEKDEEECRDRKDERKGRAIAIQRAGGDVELDEAPHGADIQTGGGRIRIGRAGGRINAQTGGGDIELGPVAGSVRATTGAGRVVLELAPVPPGEKQEVRIDAGVGAVKLVLHEEFDGRFEIETAYTQKHERTRIVSDVPLELEETSEWDDRRGTPRRYVRGRGVLGGKRDVVKISTINGDVEITKRHDKRRP